MDVEAVQMARMLLEVAREVLLDMASRALALPAHPWPLARSCPQHAQV